MRSPSPPPDPSPPASRTPTEPVASPASPPTPGPVMVQGACTTATSPRSRTRTSSISRRDSGNIHRKPRAWSSRICRRRVHQTPSTVTKSASSANRSASASASASFHAASKASATAAGEAGGRAGRRGEGSAGDMAAPGWGKGASARGPVGQQQHDDDEQRRHHGQRRQHGAHRGADTGPRGTGCVRSGGHAASVACGASGSARASSRVTWGFGGRGVRPRRRPPAPRREARPRRPAGSPPPSGSGGFRGRGPG